MNSYECPKCKGTFSEEEWNEATERACNDEITQIGDNDACDAFFFCPSCDCQFDYYELFEEEKASPINLPGEETE